jgi:hypothetical protein
VVRVLTATGGSTLGGTTGQGFPVIVDLNRTGRSVARALTVLRLPCQPSGRAAVVPDFYRSMSITRAGRFHKSFGPSTQANPDGTSVVVSGRMTGQFNTARTKVTGTWRFSGIYHDATGAVTDSCVSPIVSWHAKQ